MTNKGKYYSRLNDNGCSLLLDISSATAIQEFSSMQVMIILSMQNKITRIEEKKWIVEGKKKRHGKIDFDKFLEKFIGVI